MTILVALASPSSEGDRPQLKSPVAGTGDRSRSVGEEARAFDGALLAGAHRPMQAQRRALRHRSASCRTAAPCAFVPSAATRHVDIDVSVIVTAPPFILPLLKIKKHIVYLFFCNPTVVAKAKQRHANPWNINMIFMDELCYNVRRMD
jgi:hypothetical protein